MNHNNDARAELNQIETRSDNILKSPYMFKKLPAELTQLEALIRNMNTLLTEDVPALVSEVRRLRKENKRLEEQLHAQAEAAAEAEAEATEEEAVKAS